jgi:hypothetical protein
MDNPPAFPRPGFTDPAGMQEGMTLRDYFAGQALAICIKDFSKPYEEWALEAYALADAMLAQRETSNEQ